MEITKDQLTKMATVFEMVSDYKDLAKEHNSAASEAMTDFLDEVCPKPAGKMSPTDKAKYKEIRTEAKQWLGDSWREWLRNKKQKPDTTLEAVTTVENMLKK